MVLSPQINIIHKMELADKVIKAIPTIVYSITAFGFFLRILIDHNVIETIYFYHNDKRYVVTTDDPAVLTFLYVFVCAIISVSAYSASRQNIDNLNKIFDCIFIPTLLRALVHLNDPLTVMLFGIMYASFQVTARLASVHNEVMMVSRMWRIQLWTQFWAIWVTYTIAMIYNWNVNRPGGLAAQLASLVVCVYDFVCANRALYGTELDADRQMLALCATRFILMVCALVETV